MARNTIASQILEALAKDRRAVAADWRVHIAYLRVARAGGFALPNAGKTKQLLNKMQSAGDIQGIPDISGVYRITVPYASVLATPDEAVVQEANPKAVFSHFTAAQYHGLTNELPHEFHLTQCPKSSARLPLGTTPEDWMDAEQPRLRTPIGVHDVPIHWHKSKPEWDFGNILGHVQGYPIYVTNVERTLLDAVRFPDRCGGPLEVLRMWKRGVDGLDVGVLVDYVEKFQQTLLKQRVGFLLEKLGEPHPKLDAWAANSARGSSARLFANLDFSPENSKRWNLSINASTAALSEQGED